MRGFYNEGPTDRRRHNSSTTLCKLDVGLYNVPRPCGRRKFLPPTRPGYELMQYILRRVVREVKQYRSISSVLQDSSSVDRAPRHSGWKQKVLVVKDQLRKERLSVGGKGVA